MLLNQHSLLTINAVQAYAKTADHVISLDYTAEYQAQVALNHAFFKEELARGVHVYGATTGFGSSSGNRLNADDCAELQTHLIHFHGCGLGEPFSEEESAAITLARLASLAKVKSGISFEMLSHLDAMVQKRIFPVIPSIGSVGASGDLTPLSYLAATMMGERDVYYEGQIIPARSALDAEDLKPYRFKPREALAIMNGTSAMTGVACLAWMQAERVYTEACKITGLTVELMGGRSAAFNQSLHEVKGHLGQQDAASKIRQWLYQGDDRKEFDHCSAVIQDSYSLRCAPHILGVLKDTLDWSKTWIENELNAVSDNPIIDHHEKTITNGGHFYGGHIAQACDSLKTAVACVLNLLDRQMALVMELGPSRDLPENLAAPQPAGQINLNHGFKAVQILLSAITAEGLKQATPIAPWSRPTESANQDVVSLGTIAARELCQLNAATKNALAIMNCTMVQGFWCRGQMGKMPKLTPQSQEELVRLTEHFTPVEMDRPLDQDILRMRGYLFEDDRS